MEKQKMRDFFEKIKSKKNQKILFHILKKIKKTIFKKVGKNILNFKNKNFHKKQK